MPYDHDTRMVGIVRKLMVENSQLRRRREELLQDLQASRTLISRRLAGDDGTGYAQDVFHRILGHS
jgi:hypothetical protein